MQSFPRGQGGAEVLDGDNEGSSPLDGVVADKAVGNSSRGWREETRRVVLRSRPKRKPYGQKIRLVELFWDLRSASAAFLVNPSQ